MPDFKGFAEQEAAKSQDLPGFKDFSLQGVRDKVANILKMIGRVKGIFSTYTLHDISHIDVMLEMLDWLIPPDTREKLTPIEWLMIVLSIYLHDLGMVVTSEEYDKRMENPKFKDFIDNLGKTSEGKDYLARIKYMSPNEKEVFFYQEFVRLQHAGRIREWVTGRHSYRWSDKVKPIADEIAGLLKDLPERFKTNLGDVCESHHKSNLDDRNYFPLCGRYANNNNTIANVQYVAIILRTADLLHITKDRTPSIMFKTMGITDPMGVDEWQKQMGTFSVSIKSREFHPDDPESHVIVVKADFDEERPFFVLSEYIEYAKEQIDQSKRWADESQRTEDGKHYSFPWRSVEPDIRVEGNEPIPIKFELDRGRLLDLLVGHTIYNDPTVAVRELLQNGIDAVRFQHYLDSEEAKKTGTTPIMGDVQVKWDKEERELIVKDNGIGMNMDTIEYHLMQVGASYYDTPKFHAEHGDFSPISRFGIGILTCFMVSDDIEIITCRNEEGYRIRMSSVKANYLLKKLEPGDSCLEGLNPHGTRVRLTLRASIDLEKKSMLDIVRHWIILPECKVLFSDDDTEPQRIGFDTPADALRYFYSDEISGSESRWSQKPEIIDLPHKEGKESYDLAFAVRKSFSPEYNFIVNEGSGKPAICIEGIRVDNSLPGHGSYRGICAILFVRNNKKFRTTVSRSNIEEDEEYIKVGKIAIELLYKHLENEVNRISKLKGDPLSQASTAGQWIYHSVSISVSNKKVEEFLEELYLKLPLVVVENLKKDDGKINTYRELMPQKKLKGLESFWTIESRLVNYLGILSRDLGRELSLNDFLGKLAPELQDERITPIISDAHQFKDIILQSHRVTAVEFSRKHQQLILKWELLKKVEPRINISQEESLEVRKILVSDRISFFYLETTESFRVNLTSYSYLFSAPIRGDIQGINAVKSKLAIIVSPSNNIAIGWKTLKEAIKKISGKKGQEKFKNRIILILALFIINKVMTDSKFTFTEFDMTSDIRGYLNLWQVKVQQINDILATSGFNFVFPNKLEEFIGQKNAWFNPTDYQFDWEKRHE